MHFRDGALLILMMLLSSSLVAQRYPRHGFSLDYAGLALYGSVGLHYEFMASDRFSLRLGYGETYGGMLASGAEGRGASAMLQFMSTGFNKVEGGIGVSVMRSNFSVIFDDHDPEQEIHVYPALAFTYRTVPRRAGFYWRIGFSWIYGYGLPLTLGIGYLF
ncbi:MAG: hypothetical protein IH600_18695 [Bacteroidetes bacterium]|nr:hypothetical protein [Bacteroidota bacterium]